MWFSGFFHMHFGSLDILLDFSVIFPAISGGQNYNRFRWTAKEHSMYRRLLLPWWVVWRLNASMIFTEVVICRQESLDEQTIPWNPWKVCLGAFFRFLGFMFNFIPWCNFTEIRSDNYKLYQIMHGWLFLGPNRLFSAVRFVHWGFVPRHLFIPIRCARARRRLHAGASSEDLSAFRTVASQGRHCVLTFLHREIWHRELLKPERCICT